MQRRDFLNGIAIAVAGSQLTKPVVAQETAYPPLTQGLRGQYPDAVAEFPAIASGRYSKFPVGDSELREEYDL
jgi:hypothetical protein